MSNNNNRNNNKPQPMAVPTKQETKEQATEKETTSAISQPTQAVRPRAVQDTTPEQTQAKAKPQAIRGDDRTKTVLADYIERMRKAKNVTETAEAQAYLLTHLVTTVKLKEISDFRSVWNTTLDFFYENRKEVNELTVFQGMQAWPSSKANFDFYRALMNLVLATRDPKTRFSGLTTRIQVSQLVKVLAPLGGNARRNITSFYKV